MPKIHVYTQQSQQRLRLVTKPFAQGGEGNIFHIDRPLQLSGTHVAKIYHPSKRTDDRYTKLLYLIQHPPKDCKHIVWPKDILFDAKDNFIGYLMPLAKGEKLELICTPGNIAKLNEKWSPLAFKARGNSERRLQICFNLAHLVHQLHETNRYVLVDLKSENILVNPDGEVFLVDTDSVEVIENEKVLFSAPVATPEYSPPEYHQQRAKGQPIGPAWDRFALGILLYKILLGVHPYAASSHPPYDKATDLAQKIKAGLFVQNSKLKDSFKVVPKPHDRYRLLADILRILFERCFVAGQENPALRPSALMWALGIARSFQDRGERQRFLKILVPVFEDAKEFLEVEKVLEVGFRGWSDQLAELKGICSAHLTTMYNKKTVIEQTRSNYRTAYWDSLYHRYDELEKKESAKRVWKVVSRFALISLIIYLLIFLFASKENVWPMVSLYTFCFGQVLFTVIMISMADSPEEASKPTLKRDKLITELENRGDTPREDKADRETVFENRIEYLEKKEEKVNLVAKQINEKQKKLDFVVWKEQQTRSKTTKEQKKAVEKYRKWLDDKFVSLETDSNIWDELPTLSNQRLITILDAYKASITPPLQKAQSQIKIAENDFLAEIEKLQKEERKEQKQINLISENLERIIEKLEAKADLLPEFAEA